MVKIENSRYGESRNITNNGHNIWTVEGKAHYFRVGMTEDNTKIDYFDPEGGPFIHVGDDLGFGKIIEIAVEKNNKKDHFKVRLEVE